MNCTISDIWQIIVIVIIFSLTVLVILLISWNWGSKESVEILKPILGGLSVALFFIIISLASPIAEKSSKVIVGIFTKGDKGVLPFNTIGSGIGEDPLDNGYARIDTMLVSSFGPKIKPQEGHSYLIELFELSLFDWMLAAYPDWRFQREWVSGLAGGGGHAEINPKIDSHDIEKIYLWDLLKENMYVNFLDDKTILLPKGTDIKYLNHTIKIKTKFISAQIRFSDFGYMEKIDDTEYGKLLRSSAL